MGIKPDLWLVLTGKQGKALWKDRSLPMSVWMEQEWVSGLRDIFPSWDVEDG